jgi:hypothetical protein
VDLLTTANRTADVITTCSGLLKQPGLAPQYRAQILSYLGAAFEKQNNRAEAVAQYQAALKAVPDFPQAADALKRLNTK